MRVPGQSPGRDAFDGVHEFFGGQNPGRFFPAVQSNWAAM